MAVNGIFGIIARWQARREAMTRGIIFAATLGFILSLCYSDSPASTHAATGVSKRQIMLDCMSRRMVADRGMSYNAASKECTVRMKSQSGAPVPSMHAKR